MRKAADSGKINMKKIVSLMLALIIPTVLTLGVLAETSAGGFRDAGGRCIFDANDFKYNNSAYRVTSDITLTQESENGTRFVRLSAEAGTYDNGDLLMTLSPNYMETDPFAGRFMLIKYRTDIAAPNLQLDYITAEGGHTWLKSTVRLTNNNEWNTDVINIGDTVTALPEESVQSTITFKFWGSHSKNLKTASHIDIEFLGFFGNESEAREYQYSQLEDAAYRELFGLDSVDLRGDDERAIRGYLDDAALLKAQILANNESLEVSGVKYYVSSAHGDDSNSGKSPSEAWKTVDKVNNFKFSEGDGVYFERTGVWREQLRTQNGVTYTAYGSGAKPLFLGSVDGKDPSKWNEAYPNIWEFADTFEPENKPCNIVADNETLWGIKVEKKAGSSYRVEHGSCFNGRSYCDNSSQLEFNDESDLKSDLEYYYNPESKKFFVYSEYGNPGNAFETFEIVKAGNGIRSNPGSQNITVNNLCLKYFGNHGVGIFNAKNYTVSYCVIGFIGGNGLGNAIESWTNADNFYVHHNYAYQCYDCAFTAQGNVTDRSVTIQNVKMHDNIAEYCNSGLEFWLTTSLENHETYGTIGTMRDVELYDNYTLYAGYGWSNQRENKDYNFFYGGSAVSYSVYENFRMHDNINLFTENSGLRARPINSDNAYKLSDNVYVMKKSAISYRTASRADNFMYGIESGYKVNEYDLAKLNHYKVDVNSTYYVISNNYLPFGFNSAYDKVIGDVNGDGETDTLDMLLMLRYLNYSSRGENIFYTLSADINGDGNVTLSDAVRLARKLAGWRGYENLSSDTDDSGADRDVYSPRYGI